MIFGKLFGDCYTLGDRNQELTDHQLIKATYRVCLIADTSTSHSKVYLPRNSRILVHFQEMEEALQMVR